MNFKPKPKPSPLDMGPEFQKLVTTILSAQLKPFEQTGINVCDETDGKRLNTRDPARLVLDHIDWL